MIPTRAQWKDSTEDSTLSGYAKHVALIMCNFWPKRGEPFVLWCSIPTLMQKTSWSRPTVYRAMAELKDKGWQAQVSAGVNGRSPRYVPDVPAGCLSETTKAEGGSPTETTRVSDRTGRVSDGYPNPQRTPTGHVNPAKDESSEDLALSRSGMCSCGGRGCSRCVAEACPSCGSWALCGCETWDE